MKLIDVIDQANLDLRPAPQPEASFEPRRRAVRAVVRDHRGRVYLLKVAARGGYLKLPGGGIETGESLESALHREVLEEIGYEVSIGATIGHIIQYDRATDWRHDSICYQATITGGDGQPSLTAEELADGAAPIVFTDYDAALEALRAVATTATDHSVRIMTRRDLAFLEAAR